MQIKVKINQNNLNEQQVIEHVPQTSNPNQTTANTNFNQTIKTISKNKQPTSKQKQTRKQ